MPMPTDAVITDRGPVPMPGPPAADNLLAAAWLGRVDCCKGLLVLRNTLERAAQDLMRPDARPAEIAGRIGGVVTILGRLEAAILAEGEG